MEVRYLLDGFYLTKARIKAPDDFLCPPFAEKGRWTRPCFRALSFGSVTAGTPDLQTDIGKKKGRHSQSTVTP